jgi:hypothetical protein
MIQKENKMGTHFEVPVEAEHTMTESLEQLRALERDVEREWWWLAGLSVRSELTRNLSVLWLVGIAD